MPIPVDRLYNPTRLNLWFAVSSVLMVLAILWMVSVDYDRPWRGLQERQFANQAALAHLEYLRATSSDQEHKLGEAEELFAEAVERREHNFGEQRAKFIRELAEARLGYEKSNGPWSRASQELGVTHDSYERVLAEHGADHSLTLAAHEDLVRGEGEVDRLRREKQKWDFEVRRVERFLKWIDEPVVEAEKELTALRAVREEALSKERRYRGVLTGGGWLEGVPLVKTVINFTLLDFVAPKNTPGRQQVNQLVLPDVRAELHYLESYATDRCVTCHVAIDDPRFSEKELARALEAALPAIDESRRREGMGPVRYPVPSPSERVYGATWVAGSVTEVWGDLSEGQRDEYLSSLVEIVNRYMERIGRAPVTIGQPLLAHTDLGLFLSPNSPHAMAKVGCTVCHDGNGGETDFVLAGHSPSTRAESEVWAQEHYVRRMGIASETFEEAGRNWDRPVLEPAYSEAGCRQCHRRISDIDRNGDRRHALRLRRGKHLFTSLGCINCHAVDSIVDARRVGPDLTHVASKLSPAFVRRWMYDPQSIRPSTRMPHFFGQENNGEWSAGVLDVDPKLRSEAEVAAIAKYLFIASSPWEPLTAGEGVVGNAALGRSLFRSLGCLACHGNIAEIGEEWITRDLGLRLGIAAGEARDRCAAMSENARVRYALEHFVSEVDALAGGDYLRFDPSSPYRPPIFTRFAPELSAIGTKVDWSWLHSWITDPLHYAPGTKMPSMRLTSLEAAHITEYLVSLGGESETGGDVEVTAPVEDKYRAVADEVLFKLLSVQSSKKRVQAILDDSDGELTGMLVEQLASSHGLEPARRRIASVSAGDRLMALFGSKMISHYGCYACHVIPGFEEHARPGTDLSDWARKPVGRLDFGTLKSRSVGRREGRDQFFRGVYPEGADELRARSPLGDADLELTPTRASFAAHKLANPRIWDRGRARKPLEKLKMPNFYLTKEEVDSLVTFLLSLQPPRVTSALQIDYEHTPAGSIARGRDLMGELNCVGCHVIDGNAPVMHRYFEMIDGRSVVFDDRDAPPKLDEEGAKVQTRWVHGFLRDVEQIRPWLTVRMPSFKLSDEQVSAISAFFVGRSQEKARWLDEKLTPIREYIAAQHRKAGLGVDSGWSAVGDATGGDTAARRGPRLDEPGGDWFVQDSLEGVTDTLRDYAIRHRLVSAEALERDRSPALLAEAYESIFTQAEIMRGLLDVTYPVMDWVPDLTEEQWEDGQSLFFSLNCLGCHVFGDRSVPGANQNRMAPDLQPAHGRLRRDWIRVWVDKPQRLSAHTMMPRMFGETPAGPFASFTAEDRNRIESQLKDKSLMDDRAGQIESVIGFIFESGRLGRDEVPSVSGPS